MSRDRRAVVPVLFLLAVMDGVGLVLQQTGSTHAPVAVSVLTALVGGLVLLAVYGLSRARSWGWPLAVGSSLVSGAIATGALLQDIPAEKKLAAAAGLAVAALALAVVLPLREAHRGVSA
jgi:hypothetical protein